MKERPVLFNGPMVRALLEGRKTQTRRLVDMDSLRGVLHRTVQGDSIFSNIEAKPGIHKLWANRNFAISADMGETKLGLRPGEFNFLSPFGGECTATTNNRRWTLTPTEPCRLWVRETFATLAPGSYEEEPPRKEPGQVLRYAANREDAALARCNDQRWRPCIHMPRWASRITLEVMEVRIERLQDITEEDAWAEGCIPGEQKDNGGSFPAEIPHKDGGLEGWDCARDWFADLWDSIYGADPRMSLSAWDANPWVWVTGFRRVET